MTKVGVIGAGSLGTALAQTIAHNVDEVYLQSRRQSLVDTINNTGFNAEYYPNVKLMENICATTDLNDLAGCRFIFLAIPSSAFRDVLEKLQSIIDDCAIIVTGAKGIEYPSLNTMGDLISQNYDDYVALSGPNFASEIMLNLPTVTNIASQNQDYSIKIKNLLSSDQFKVKIIDDVKGLELCGVLKNINAIANGICEGMNINENARFAILTNGFNDIGNIIESFGGDSKTVNGYCGFGDLMMTSTSTESRNHTLGILYGQRLILDEISSGVVFEGKNSIMAVKDICDQNNIQSNIVDFVYEVIIEKLNPKIAFKKLWENIE